MLYPPRLGGQMPMGICDFKELVDPATPSRLIWRLIRNRFKNTWQREQLLTIICLYPTNAAVPRDHSRARQAIF